MQKKIKITYIISELKIGGAEKLLESIINKLDDEVFIVNLIVLGEKEENTLYKSIVQKGVNIFYCNKKGKEIIKCSQKINKILSKINPDIVHVHTSILYLTIWGILANNIKGRFYTIHSMPEFDSPGLKKYIYSLFFKYAGIKGIAISKRIEEASKAYFKTSNIIRIENGVEIEKFKSGIPISKRNNKGILHVGRFVDVKNQKLLIESVSMIDNLNLNVTFVGDGETLVENKRLVSKLDLEDRVKFLGRRNDISNIMDKNTIFVLCSTMEGAPISIIEAMANGMAIIATDVGGVRDFIDDGKNGVIVNSNSPDELAAAIKWLLGDEKKVSELSKNAIIKSKNYDMKVCVDKHISLYKNILKIR